MMLSNFFFYTKCTAFLGGHFLGTRYSSWIGLLGGEHVQSTEEAAFLLRPVCCLVMSYWQVGEGLFLFIVACVVYLACH